MTTKLGGKANAAYYVTDEQLAVFPLEGGFTATPVYGVMVDDPTEGGNLLPIYVIDSSDLVENGGRFRLAKGTPIPINTFLTNRDVVRGRAIPVYVMGGLVGRLPATPTNLAISATTSTTITLTWTDMATDETGFSLERSTDGVTFVEITTLSANVVTYQNTGLTPEVTYYYRLRSVNGAIYSLYSSTVSGTTLPIYYLNDTFTTARSAGAVNATAAEPGPGTRTITATSDTFSISSGSLQMDGYTSNGDPRMGYSSAITRTPGRILIGHFSAPGSLGTYQLGFGITVPTAAPRTGIVFNNAGSIYSMEVGSISTRVLGAYVASVNYMFAVILRSSGQFVFIKGGIYTQWSLLWTTSSESQSTLYVTLGKNNNSNNGAISWVRVPSALWLPTPLASDGFSAWGTTDGLGHAETSGLGSGGSGESWTSNVGTFTASSGSAKASALSGGVAIATIDTSEADVVATVKVTRLAGNAGLVVRYADSSNYVYALHNGTNAQLIKVVAGTPTTLINTATTYVAGADLRVVCETTGFRLYYNGLLIGSQQTISDAGLQSGTKQGLYTSDTTNTFDDLRVFARGTGSEYSELDLYAELLAPSGLSVGSATPTTLTLTWTDNSSGEDGFKIERSADGVSGWTQISTVAAGVQTYQNTGLSFSTTYYYRVRAYNSQINSDYTSVANGSTTAGSAIDFGTFEYWQGGMLPPGAMNGVNSGDFEYWQGGMLPPVFTVV